MLIKDIVDEDFINYKVPSMLIACSTCSWKCGKDVCQNSSLENMKDHDVPVQMVVER